MIHIRVDDEELNSKRRFACGIGPELPAGDTYYFPEDALCFHKADCPGCNPGGPEPIGRPLSQLSGRPGYPGYHQFCEIAASWGYE
jgi:hypothetical protein